MTAEVWIIYKFLPRGIEGTGTPASVGDVNLIIQMKTDEYLSALFVSSLPFSKVQSSSSWCEGADTSVVVFACTEAKVSKETNVAMEFRSGSQALFCSRTFIRNVRMK